MDTSSALNGEVAFTGLSLIALVDVQSSMTVIIRAERKELFIWQYLTCFSLDTRSA